jgi:hypothetical protein
MMPAAGIGGQTMDMHLFSSSDVGQFLLVPLIIAMIIVFAVWSIYASMKRRQALTTLAAQLGFVFEPDRDSSRLGGRFDRIDLLQQGSDRYTENHLIGRVDGTPVTVCDFHYETGSGKNRTDHYFGVVFVVIPLKMPEVRIREEGLFDKLAAAVGFDDIDFESAEFSKRYYVGAAERKFAYDLIHARAIEFLLAHPDYSWEFEGDTIAMYQEDRFKPEQIRGAIEIAAGFVKLIPEFVWQERGIALREGEHA